MASQGSQSTPLSYICLPLLKFSYATAAEGVAAPIPWKHISTNGELSVVLDTIDSTGPAGAVEKRQHFRVLQGNDVLEDIDLDILASEAQKATNMVKPSQAHPPNPLITVIVRLPCVAMRYPLAGGRVRRFQVRFAEDEGFYEMMKRLSRAEIPFMEAGQNNAQPTSTNNLHVGSSFSMPGQQCSAAGNQRPSTATLYEHHMSSQSASAPLDTNASSMIRPSTSDGLMRCEQRPLVSQSSRNNELYGPDKLNRSALSTEFNVATSTSADDAPYTNVFTASVSNLPSSSVPALGFSSSAPEPKSDMPPRRELPFAQKTKKTGSIEIIPPPSLLAVSASRNTKVLTSPDTSASNDTERTEQPQKGTKRAASKPKKEPAPKKARTATSRTKNSAKNGEQNKPVPSVDELLRQKMAEKDTSPNHHEALDTQITADRTEQKLGSTRSTRSSSKARAPSINAGGEASDRLRSQSHISEKARECASMQADKQIIPSTVVPAQPISSNTSISTALPGIQQRQSQSNDDPTQSDAFTRSISSGLITRHEGNLPDDLSQEDRHRAIEMWICEQVSNEDFMNVCKAVNSVWARAFGSPERSLSIRGRSFFDD